MAKNEFDFSNDAERDFAVAAFVKEVNQTGNIDRYFFPREGRQKLQDVQLSIRMVRGKFAHSRGDFEQDESDQGSFFTDGELGFVLNAQRKGDKHPTLVAVTSFNLVRTTQEESVISPTFEEYRVNDGETIFPRILQLQGLTKETSALADSRRELAVAVIDTYDVWDGLVKLVTQFAVENERPAVGILPSSKNRSKTKPEFYTQTMFQRYDQYALTHGFKQETPNGFYLKRLAKGRR